MSDRPCNLCSLNAMKREAAQRGATVIVTVETKELAGWMAVRYSDEDAAHRWMKVIPDECAC